MSRFLSKAELVELTGRHTRPAQIRRLKAKGIAYIDDPAAASVTVLWSSVHRAAGEPEPGGKRTAADFSSLEV